MAYTSTVIPNGAELDRRLEYVKFLEQSNSQPIGIEWDTAISSPTLKRIDINGNEIATSATFFDNHRIWGGIRTCVRNRTTGAITYGSDNAGTGLAFDGSAGDVFVEIPTAKYKFWSSGTVRRLWVIPYTTEDTKYLIHPAAVQRGGTFRPKIMVAAYEASLRDSSGTLKLASVSGVQPWTGGELKSLAYTSGGTNTFTQGETLTGATSGATGIIISYDVSGGTFAGGDAAGTVYMKTVTGTFQAENLNGSTSGSNCATIAADATVISFNMDQAEGYANAIGSGFGVKNIWTDAYIKLLQYIEYGTFHLQNALGKGICLLATGTGYGGMNTGADSIDSRLAANGTGTGSGTNGYTPIRWRGLENLWGNNWKFLIGLNMILTDGTYKILKRDGTGTPAAELLDGSYETGIGTIVNNADGYITGLQADEMGALAMIPLGVGASDSTYLCDYFYRARYSPSVVTGGGAHYHGNFAGPACKSANNNTIDSGRIMTARIEYIGA